MRQLAGKPQKGNHGKRNVRSAAQMKHNVEAMMKPQEVSVPPLAADAAVQ